MAFTNNEVLRLSGNVLAAGVIDSNPNSAWYEKINVNNFIIDPETIWSQMDELKQLPASSFAQAVSNSVARPDLIRRIGINADGSFDDATALRMTPVAGTNFTTYAAYIDFGDATSGTQRSWIMPQMIPRSNGFPSAAYSPVIFSGLPSEGNRILTSTGNDGVWVSHFWNAAGGLLLIAEDSAPPSASFPNQTIHICGFVYEGEVGGGGATSDAGNVYVESYLNENISVGDKFTNYNGVICIKDHIGKWPMDIFDGNWKRIGDDRMFRFEGTEQQKLTRLLPSYSQSIPVDLAEGTTVFATSTRDRITSPVDNIFYPSLKQDNGEYTVAGGWQSQVGQVTNQRVYYDTGTLQVFNGLFYVNGLGERGSQRVTVYTSTEQPVHNQWAANEGLVQRYDGTLEFRPDEEDTTSANNHIAFTDDLSEYQWIIIDISTNYGGDTTDIQWVQPYQGIAEVSTLPPAIGTFTTYDPIWGDNGNNQGRVILNVNVGGNGATEWAYSDVDNLPTLHFRERDVLADKEGELILFEPNLQVRSFLNLPITDDAAAADSSSILVVDERNRSLAIELGALTTPTTTIIVPRLMIHNSVNEINIRFTDSKDTRLLVAEPNFDISFYEGTDLIDPDTISIPFQDVTTNTRMTFIRDYTTPNNDWIRIN